MGLISWDPGPWIFGPGPQASSFRFTAPSDPLEAEDGMQRITDRRQEPPPRHRSTATAREAFDDQ